MVKRLLLLLLAFLLFYSPAWGASKHIRPVNDCTGAPCGSADGSDWDNAYNGFADVSWVRGDDVYYYKSGNYSEAVTIAVAESGTTLLTIKKATVAEHGSNTGWDDDFATGQAIVLGADGVRDGITINNSYITLDGVTGSGSSGHGLKVEYSHRCDAYPKALCLISGYGGPTTGITDLIPYMATSGWTLQSDGTGAWTITGGVLTKTASAGTLTATAVSGMTSAPTAGVTYRVVITASAASGTLTYALGGTAGSTAITAATLTDYITATNTDKLVVTGASDATATITSINITDVLSVACCTGASTGTPPDCDDAAYGINLAAGKSFITLNGVEIEMCGVSTSRVTRGIVQNNVAGTSKGILFQNLYIHDGTENGFTLLGQQGTSYSDYGMLVDGLYLSAFKGMYADIHGQGFQFGTLTTQKYIIIRNSTLHDISGSGHISLLGGSHNYYFRIYNNIFSASNSTTYNVSPGPIWSHYGSGASTNETTDFEIDNNVFYNISKAGIFLYGAYDGYTPVIERVALKNNIFESCNFPTDHNNVTTKLTNGYCNNTGAYAPSDVDCTGGASTFTNPATYDFTLKTGGYAIGKGTDLSEIFTTDITGATRATWDIGAYEYYEQGSIHGVTSMGVSRQ